MNDRDGDKLNLLADFLNLDFLNQTAFTLRPERRFITFTVNWSFIVISTALRSRRELGPGVQLLPLVTLPFLTRNLIESRIPQYNNCLISR